MSLPADPLEPGGIRAYGERLRRGEITALAAVEAYLGRIEALDAKLGAFEHVAGHSALETARAIDRLLAAGTDLGPLMGVPVAVKDIFVVDGMPTTAGSRLDVSDILASHEGSFVRALRRAGCVLLGKTRTVEFALGASGISKPRGTPWNPWDAEAQRIPGGSSSGSAVAVAAGLCALATGSDTGGSVRVPAAFCGIFGLKTTVGLWPLDGVFPLSRELDSIGPLTRTAADAALVFAALTGRPAPRPHAPRGLRLGRPCDYFYDDMAPEVQRCVEAALRMLEEAGAELVPVDTPEAAERETHFPVALPSELVATLGRERFRAAREVMDPTIWQRASRGLEVRADEHLHLFWRRQELRRIAHERMAGLDGWVTPASTILPARVADFATPEDGIRLTMAATRCSQPGNLFGLCGTSTPIAWLGAAPLPVGLQVLCGAFDEDRALAIALLLEDLFGPPRRPDLSAFL